MWEPETPGLSANTFSPGVSPNGECNMPANDDSFLNARAIRELSERIDNLDQRLKAVSDIATWCESILSDGGVQRKLMLDTRYPKRNTA